MVTAPVQREVVRAMVTRGVSERRALAVNRHTRLRSRRHSVIGAGPWGCRAGARPRGILPGLTKKSLSIHLRAPALRLRPPPSHRGQPLIDLPRQLLPSVSFARGFRVRPAVARSVDPSLACPGWSVPPAIRRHSESDRL
jgi:hypothetical protein